MKHPIVLAITGASGVIYGQRLLQALLMSEIEVHLTISDSGRLVLEHELGITIDLDQFSIELLVGESISTISKQALAGVHYHHYKDFMTPIASGSHKTSGMIVCPCSGSTLSGIASAASQNLVQRAADVHLKERRPLILVPRETPLSMIQLDNLRTAASAGATILPASPGFYHGYRSVDDLVNFIVARILDQLDIEHTLMKRWGADES